MSAQAQQKALGTGSLRVAHDNASLRERTTEVLRGAILTMQFRPGQRLIERQLVRDTGVSRTCVRESMRHLEAEGLVRREHNKGIFVASITADEARDIYEVRKNLEVAMLIKFIDRATHSDCDALEAMLAKAAKLAEKKPLEYVRALGEMIGYFWKGASNKVADHLLSSLLARISYIRVLLATSTAPEERRVTISILSEVVESIKSGDTATAKARYIAYLDRGCDRAIMIIKDMPGA